MYSIGMFSKLGRVTIKTLRHYDEVGLLIPAYVDDENGYRYYTTDQLFQLNQIVALRQMGFSIVQILDIIAGHNVIDLLEQRKTEILAEQTQITDQLFRLEHFMLEQKEGYYMKYQAVLKDIPAYTIYAMECVVPHYGALSQVMPQLEEKVRILNPDLQYLKPPYCFNIYLDATYKERDVHVEICQAVTKRGIDGEGIVFKDLPATTVVSVLHRGAYENLGNAYAYAVKWVNDNGYKISGSLRESYIAGMWNKENIEDWLTEIQVPVIKK